MTKKIHVDLGDEVEVHRKNLEKELQELQELVKDDIAAAGDVATPVDWLFLLRFLLSNNGDVRKSAEAVKSCLEWRKAHIEDLRATQSKSNKVLERFQCFDYVAEVGDVGHPVSVVRTAKSDIIGLMNSLTVDEAVHALLMNNEVGFQICDKKTRETGRFVKNVVVVDMQEFSVFQNDRRFSKVQGKSSHMSSDLYPQLLGKTCLVNVPSSLYFLLKAVQLVLSKATLEKQILCGATHKIGSYDQAVKNCSCLNTLGKLEDMPDFLGGKLVDYSKRLVPVHERESITSVTLKQGESNQVELSVPKDATAHVDIYVTKGTCEFNVTFESEPMCEAFHLTAKDGLRILDFVAKDKPGKIIVKCFNTHKSKTNLMVNLFEKK